MQKNIFISYSHADNENHMWAERLEGFLGALQDELPLNVWVDTKIPPGADWRNTIQEALDNSAAAILLVGQGFLASRYVKEKELPILLPANKKNALPPYILYVGYCPWQFSVLEPYQAFNNPDEPLESLDTPQQNKWFNDLCVAIKKDMEKAGVVNTKPEPVNELYTPMLSIQNHLEITHTAFQAQMNRAKRLLISVRERLDIEEHLQYEEFFFKYYDHMNEEEHFQFDQIRALTEGGIFEGNNSILQLIEEHPHLRETLPIIGALKKHLSIWLNKYKKVFIKNKKMAVCFTGVEDGVPFPFGVDEEVANWLSLHRT